MNTIKHFFILFFLALATISIAQPGSQCPAPTGFQVIAATPTTLTFSWTPSPNALNYRLQVTGPGFSLDTTVVAPPVTVTGLQPNTTYTATLNANCPSPTGPIPGKKVTIQAATSGIIIVDVVEKPNKTDMPSTSDICKRLNGISCSGVFVTALYPVAWPPTLGHTWVYQIVIEKTGTGVKSQVIFTCKRNSPDGISPKFTLTNYLDCANCKPCTFCQQNSPPKGNYLPLPNVLAFLSIVLPTGETLSIELATAGFTVKINNSPPTNKGYTVTYKTCPL